MTESVKMLINGVASYSIDARDRGLQYGDGVFETMAYDGHQVVLFERHYERLSYACEKLEVPVVDEHVLRHDIEQLVTAATPCVVKLVLTRGIGGFGYAPAAHDATEVTRIVSVLPWPEETQEQKLGLCCDVLKCVLGTSPLLAGLKHLNRLEQVLAAKELQNRELDEGLLCNQDGFLIEAVSSNVFLVFGERVCTPKLTTAGVRGIARDEIIRRAAQAGGTIHKDHIYVDAISEADEIILCNSIRGVRAVGMLGDQVRSRRTVCDRLKVLWEGT